MVEILIVEDAELQAALLQNFVESSHTVVGWARNAKQAVELTQEKDPDVVVMDINLDTGNGLEATEQIKAYDREIPVIISTVHVSGRVKARVLDTGVEDYLTKPYGKEELLAAIDRVCQST